MVVHSISGLISNMEANLIVTVKDGQLRGSIQKLCDETDYFSFKGIPYAQPPIGKLRFKAPIPVRPWKGIREASEHGPVCPQFDVYARQLQPGSEDCLFLNVYTKSLNTDAKKPVMVFIHGGTFRFGSGDTSFYGPEYIIQHDVVLVTINYRLEIFGFLCLDIPEVPGNAGMKDQVLALRWVQNNIDQFGGDRDNVTIFGQSAGAASVTYHMVSPMSHGLFHKAIAESGTFNVDWAQAGDVRNQAFKVCKTLGKDTNDPVEALEFLQSVPALNLIRKSYYKSVTKEEENRRHFLPVVEKFPNDAFLLEKPEDLLGRGKAQNIPLMIGYNEKEAMMVVPLELRKLDYRNKNPSSHVPRCIFRSVPNDKLKEFGERLKDFYANGKDMTEEDTEIICSLLSDLFFISPIHIFTYNYAKISNSIFMYRFNFDTELNVFKTIMGVNMKGASHGDEVFHIFCNVFNKDIYQENEKIKGIVDQLSRIWTDFAKTGNPTFSSPEIRWDPYSMNGKEYLNLDENFSLGKFADKERVEFWNKIYIEAGLLHISKSKL